MASVSMKLDGRFKKRLRVLFAGYTADVGILVDKPHRNPLTIQQVKKRVKTAQGKDSALSTRTAFLNSRFKTYAGGPARKTGSGSNGTLSEISEKLRQNTGINIFTRPFRLKTNREILKFSQGFVGAILRRGVSFKRVENLLQAIVRNPILRGDYGKNKPSTAKSKGFNRFMIDTAQLFQNIKAKVQRRSRV